MSKSFVKIEHLVYFNKLKKYIKICDQGTQLLEVQSKKKYCLCNYYMFFLFQPVINIY